MTFRNTGVARLWRSYFVGQIEEFGAIPQDLSTMEGLLADKNGLTSFKKFLTKEFSVENILFYEEIEEYRSKKKAGSTDLDLVAEAQRIYAKYIITDSPFQVNLPDVIIKNLEIALKELFSGNVTNSERPEVLRSMSTSEGLQRQPPTLFDRAQENIFKLMNSDSFPRYVRSDEYKTLLADVDRRVKKITILGEEGLVDKKGHRESQPAKDEREEHVEDP